MDLFDIAVAKKLAGGGGGGGDVSIDALSIIENGTYTAPSGHAYSPVTVSVPTGGGGDHDDEDAIIKRSISGAYVNSRVTKIGEYAFYKCGSLAEVSFPNLTIDIASSAFYSCSKLTKAYFSQDPEYTGRLNIRKDAFVNCSSLMTLIINTSSVASLASTNVFNSTPIVNSTYTGAFGSIYVPASLVDSYKASTYWSALSARITSIV